MNELERSLLVLLYEKYKNSKKETGSNIITRRTKISPNVLYKDYNANTADIDKEVIVSYAAIHCGLTQELINNYKYYPSKEEMVKELSDKKIGYDFKKDKPYDWHKLSNKKDKTKGIEKYWLANHLSYNMGDLRLIKKLPDCDLLTYSTPCTDISIAGQNAGLNWICQTCQYEYDPSILNVNNRYICPNCGGKHIKSTRSGLLYEIERLLVGAKENNNLPKFLLMENVDSLVSKKYINNFNDWMNRLNNLGYKTYYQTINAKNTGIPQNRNRIFCISILKNIDMGKFQFPIPFDIGIRLKDLLESDEKILDKYFLSDEVQRRLQITDLQFEKNIIGTTKGQNCTRLGQRDLVYKEDCIMGTLTATDYKQPKQIYVNNRPLHIADLCSDKFMKMYEQTRRIYSIDGVAPTLHTCGGGNQEIKISKNNLKLVRKLTPKEAYRLMGFEDIDYENCKALGMSDSQGYKQTGNSIVVTVIALLIEHLYKAQYDDNFICTDEKMINFQKPQEVK